MVVAKCGNPLPKTILPLDAQLAAAAAALGPGVEPSCLWSPSVPARMDPLSFVCCTSPVSPLGQSGSSKDRSAPRCRPTPS